MTTVVKQYYELKKKHPEVTLIFHCGDFYETYVDDAKVCSEVLAITLTKDSRRKDKEGNPLTVAGFPYHALNTYIPKLIRSGHKVAICETIQEQKTKPKRSITELVKH